MTPERLNLWKKLFVEILEDELANYDTWLLSRSEIGELIFGQYKMDTPESEIAAWEKFWAEQEKAIDIIFKESKSL